jgi:hypothetical protein
VHHWKDVRRFVNRSPLSPRVIANLVGNDKTVPGRHQPPDNGAMEPWRQLLPFSVRYARTRLPTTVRRSCVQAGWNRVSNRSLLAHEPIVAEHCRFVAELQQRAVSIPRICASCDLASGEAANPNM